MCGCSYSCKFVREYYEDSQELSEEQRKLLNSSWAAKRKISHEEREKRKALELEAQKDMWKRVQEEMDKEKDEKEVIKQEDDSMKEPEIKDGGLDEKKQVVQIEAA